MHEVGESCGADGIGDAVIGPGYAVGDVYKSVVVSAMYISVFRFVIGFKGIGFTFYLVKN